MLETFKIKTKVNNDIEAFYIVSDLENRGLKVLEIEYKGKKWIFGNNETAVHFLKNRYFDFEENKEIIK